MSHPQQLAFLEIVIETIGDRKNNQRVLEIGSYDVNGTVRDIVGTCEYYLGVDLIDGPGVDQVGFGHELDFDGESFDLTISAECFEHDFYWTKTFLNMIRLTKSSGIVAFTCASLGRPEHGTLRSDPSLSPGTQSMNLDYYRNLTEKDFRESIDLSDFFSDFLFYYNPISWDLYFMGIKKPLSNELTLKMDLPSSDKIKARAGRMSLGHQVIRLPLRIFLKILPISIYNEIAYKYWKLLVGIVRKIGGGAS